MNLQELQDEYSKMLDEISRKSRQLDNLKIQAEILLKQIEELLEHQIYR